MSLLSRLQEAWLCAPNECKDGCQLSLRGSRASSDKKVAVKPVASVPGYEHRGFEVIALKREV